MDRPNLYLSYKQDTSRLLFWIIDTSNSIVRRAADPGKCAPVTIKTTGQCTVAEMVEMAQLVAKYQHPAPTTILKLFWAIIRARTSMYKSYQQVLKMQPDPVIEKSNASHRHFIDALQQAFDALGGIGSLSTTDNRADQTSSNSEIDESLFCNRFSALGCQESKQEAAETKAENSHDEDGQNETIKKLQKKTNKKKGKKAMKRKRSKQNSKAKTSTAADALADVPIDSYRLIEDDDGILSDYRLAIHSVINEWRDLRSTTQNLWYEVAYEGLNAAVAASLNHMAVAMVQQTCIAVFRDFPGYESYETIVKTIAGCDVDKIAVDCPISLSRLSGTGTCASIVHEDVDINEQLWIHTYNDLLDFLTDFRQSRRLGKPTKNMLKQLEDWDPKFDLTRVTNKERVRWRRAYTIKWLYDLVNVFSSVFDPGHTVGTPRHSYKKVAWSNTGPWHEFRRLLDLNGFATFITTLATQKSATNVRARILPHHVFQLQSAVESFTVARGWTAHPSCGHITTQPPPRSNPRRDLDLFLGHDGTPVVGGIIHATHFLRHYLQEDFETQHLAPQTYASLETSLKDMQFTFMYLLGESTYLHDRADIPLSVFSQHNRNGLWEYSPLLCGAGLVEGLVWAQRVSMSMWDNLIYPTLLAHLHNMLVKKSYLARGVELFLVLEEVHAKDFFPDGKPTSNFHECVLGLIKRRNYMISASERRQRGRQPMKDVHDKLGPESNLLFNAKSMLKTYQDAQWLPHQVPNHALGSFSYVLRAANTALMTDGPLAENHDLDQLLGGRNKNAILEVLSNLKPCSSAEFPESDRTVLGQQIEDRNDKKKKPPVDPYDFTKSIGRRTQGYEQLKLIRNDIFADVCGVAPISALNYSSVTAAMVVLTGSIMFRLRDARHPLYVQMYENAPPGKEISRQELLILAIMEDQDSKGLELCAEVFEEHRTGPTEHAFWKTFRTDEGGFMAQGTMVFCDLNQD